MIQLPDELNLIVGLALLALLPFIAVMATSFVKLAVVFSLLRNALGVQQSSINMALLALLPFIAVMATSFVKLAVVFSLLRNALGVQQIPPNMAMYGLAIILSIYVMAPVGFATQDYLRQNEVSLAKSESVEKFLDEGMAPYRAFLKKQIKPREHAFFIDSTKQLWPSEYADQLEPELLGPLDEGMAPYRAFLKKQIKPREHAFFIDSTKQLWPSEYADQLEPDSLLILLPAFTVSELSRAFEIGFLIYLPFIAIDLIISNILLAMGMMMVSPMTISLPFKLLLFVLLDGWARLTHGLVTSYGG